MVRLFSECFYYLQFKQYSWTSFQSHNYEKTLLQLNFYTVFIFSIAEANTIPMETTEEQLLRSEPPGSEQGTTETKCYSRQTSLSQREKDTKHTQGFYNTEKDHCKIKAAQDIVPHPSSRLDGLITIVRRRLKQEVSITVAPCSESELLLHMLFVPCRVIL
ncbi:uncharacterized protein LOC122956444 [Acropora millepora]|uniref:uncharacterized protein LOC122956444 n=1 Tax=Acropora millepora TaxID=45264 RepID=UPI001CF0EE51|nr:uncharacterized protein LOC122956444 [Acropora millepora]